MGIFLCLILSCCTTYKCSEWKDDQAKAQKQAEEAEKDRRIKNIMAELEAERKAKEQDENMAFLALTNIQQTNEIRKHIKKDLTIAQRYVDLLSNQHPQKKSLINEVDNERKKRIRESEIESRKDYAKKLERDMLNNGLNVRITTRGQNIETLHVRWVLATRVLAHRLSQEDDGLLDGARRLGFKRVILTDGYDYTVSWTF